MTRRRLFFHSVFLLLLPIIVAVFGVSVTGSVALVVLMLAWRWMISISGLVVPERSPALALDTIGVSHFAEKVRWCMDRLELEYTESKAVGTVLVWLTGRTVPRLRFRTGAVESSIGNSPEILRYLWGRYGAGDDRAAFLEPTPERLALEKDLDRYGRSQQVWIYYHLPENRELMLRAWGANDPATPAWQRLFANACYPLLTFLIRKSFRVSQLHYEKSVERIETLLEDIDMRLADGRRSILGGDSINYTDIAFAALSGVWLQPDGYGGGKADNERIDRDSAPEGMRRDIERWIEDYPKAVAFIENLYTNERLTKTKPGNRGPRTQ